MKTTILALAALGGLLATPALADTTSGNMQVTATVPKTCAVIGASTLTFGNVDQNASDINETLAGVLSLQCTDTTTWFVTADNGQNASGTQRQMVNGSDPTAFIKYNIFSDSAHSTPFPTTVGTLGSAPTGGTGNGNIQSIPVYAVIPAFQPLPSPGDYADTLRLTVNY